MYKLRRTAGCVFSDLTTAHAIFFRVKYKGENEDKIRGYATASSFNFLRY